jgi:hypothetical protein
LKLDFFNLCSFKFEPIGQVDISNSRSTARRNTESLQNLSVSRFEVYSQTLQNLKTELIDNDEYFLNNLSSEYKFLMDHLISRCTFNFENMLNEKVDKDESATSTSSSLTIEEQKNLALYYLSTKNFEEFLLANFDLEILVELLNDLLYALPQNLIPSRYIDFFIYAENVYEKFLNLLRYVPRSHLILFELIVKFLQIYSKCLLTCQSNLSEMLAEAIFQINKTGENKARENVITQAVGTFLKVFINNHTRFLTI